MLRRSISPQPCGRKIERRETEMNYSVYKNGIRLETRSCRIFPKPYNSFSEMEYVMFRAEDGTELVIESEVKIREAVIRPLSSGTKFELRDGRIYLHLDGPAKLSVEINGSSENNLMVFAHKKEYGVPDNAGQLIILKRECEYTGTLNIDKDNTTVYIEDGAVLHGNIRAEGCSGLTVCGLGKICMERYTYEMRKDYARSVDIINCKNVVIDGIIIDDSNDWSMRINGCENVSIKNVKIFGCRGNSDGIDVCGSRNVTVSDIFTRVWDDSFVVKALGTGNSENIVFRDSVLWNDFARPIEVGVELRADKVRNIRFENIDVIHSSTGYPIMGIHHGDHAEVSDIIFKDIRIEDTPGAQLFDVRIADSVWNRDGMMGRIRNITFSDINYIGSEDSDVMLSDPRIEGFDDEHDIQNVSFHNITVKGKKAVNAEELGLSVYEHVGGISVTSDLDLPEAARLRCKISETGAFKLCGNGRYRGKISVQLWNDTSEHLSGTAVLSVSPKNSAAQTDIDYDLRPGMSTGFELETELQPGKYIFFIKNKNNEIENAFLYKELEAVMYDGEQGNTYEFVNYYGINDISLRLGIKNGCLTAENVSGVESEFVIYTAMPAERREGEIIFSAEETDFGEVCAYVKRGCKLVPAPQLRCPAEITYVFRNEPKVKEIRKTKLVLRAGEGAEIPFEELGIDRDADVFLLEAAAETAETSGLRYPYTLFHSTAPDSTAHMYGFVRMIRRNKQC